MSTTAKSTVTRKFQTTVPKSVREQLGISPLDTLQWQVVGREARVSGTRPAFLSRRGSIQEGPGDAVTASRQARQRWGIE